MYWGITKKKSQRKNYVTKFDYYVQNEPWYWWSQMIGIENEVTGKVVWYWWYIKWWIHGESMFENRLKLQQQPILPLLSRSLRFSVSLRKMSYLIGVDLKERKKNKYKLSFEVLISLFLLFVKLTSIKSISSPTNNIMSFYKLRPNINCC